jgi:hypothetical protein
MGTRTARIEMDERDEGQSANHQIELTNRSIDQLTLQAPLDAI